MYNTAVLEGRNLAIVPPQRLSAVYLRENDFGDFHGLPSVGSHNNSAPSDAVTHGIRDSFGNAADFNFVREAEGLNQHVTTRRW